MQGSCTAQVVVFPLLLPIQLKTDYNCRHNLALKVLMFPLWRLLVLFSSYQGFSFSGLCVGGNGNPENGNIAAVNSLFRSRITFLEPPQIPV